MADIAPGVLPTGTGIRSVLMDYALVWLLVLWFMTIWSSSQESG